MASWRLRAELTFGERSIAYKTSHALHNATPTPYASNPRQIYHTLNPHPALTPIPSTYIDPTLSPETQAQAQNEAVYRQLLVQGVLAVLLPTEDLENPCLRALVGDVGADLGLGNAVGKGCKAETIWGIVAVVFEAVGKKMEGSGSGGANNRGGEGEEKGPQRRRKQSRFTSMIWSILQGLYSGYLVLTFIILGLHRAYSQQRKEKRAFTSSLSIINDNGKTDPSQDLPLQGRKKRRPVLGYACFELVAELLDLRARMPWVCAMGGLGRYWLVEGVGGVGDDGGVLDL